MTNTLHITREHLDKDNYYIGPDVSYYDGDIVLAPNLGIVTFKTNISVLGSILAKRGTNIKTSEYIEVSGDIKVSKNLEAGKSIQAYGSIKVGGSIKASNGIRAGLSIEARDSIQSGASIKAGKSIRSDWRIEAGSDIYAGGNIIASKGIESGLSIEAGRNIKAGKGIRAGFFIYCKTLSAGLPIFAGTATWVRPSKDETQIRCEKLHGTVAYGELVLSTKEPNLNTTSTSKPISKKKESEVA